MGRVIIIGAGPAGCAAAIQCKRLGLDVTLIDKTGIPGGLISNAFFIENYPGLDKPITGLRFARRLEQHLARFQIDILKSDVHKVRAIAGVGFEVQTDKGTLEAGNVIVATGTRPKKIGLQQEASLASENLLFHEVKDLLPLKKRMKQVVIIGGGEASFDYALSLAGVGVSVKVLCRRERVKARGRLADLVDDSKRIQVCLNTGINKISREGALARVDVSQTDKLHNIETIQCDAIVVAIGREHCTKTLLEDFEFKLPASTLTPAPGLFICGDARLGTLGQAGIAVGDGLGAAMEIAGMENPG